MGNCDSCLDLLELKFLQSGYTKIPEEELTSNHSSYPSHRPCPEKQNKNGFLDDAMLTDPNFELIRMKCNNKSKFSSGYLLGDLLGNGAFSEVKFGTSLVSGENFAIKIIDVKQQTQGFDVHRIYTEIDILQSVHHPSIVKLYNVFCEYPRLFLVLELVTGGELFDRIVSKEYFSEKSARDIVKEALLVLCFLHGDARVVHRDIKPENFIMASDNPEDFRLKLVDFGFASRVEDLKPNEISVGTPVYVAPEIIRGDPYGTEVDMWSFGVICYIILCGCPPFLHDDISGLLEKIVEGHLTFEEEQWKEVSIEAIDFCRKMLCVDQCDRWTARQMLNHKWMTSTTEESCGKRHLSNSISQLKINSIRLKKLAQGTEMISRRKSISTESPTKYGMKSKGLGLPSSQQLATESGDSSRKRAVTILL